MHVFLEVNINRSITGGTAIIELTLKLVLSKEEVLVELTVRYLPVYRCRSWWIKNHEKLMNTSNWPTIKLKSAYY